MSTPRFSLCLTLCGLFFTGASQSADGQEKAIANSIDMKFVLIPAGKFMMGSPVAEPEREADELQHEAVITKPFYLGVYEVTQGQYAKIMGKHNPHFNAKNGGGEDFPVEQVRWKEVIDFCTKLSQLPEEAKAGRTYRLPTEAEWEYACRAGSTTVFHFGDGLSSTQANFNGDYPEGKADKGPYLKKTAKVGSYKPNAWGLYDMHGNVSEFCADWYDPNYYKTSPKEDPKGPDKGVVPTGFADDHFRVVRGGCWHDEARACRAAYRFRLQSSEPYRLVGFRVVCQVSGAKP
jgi:formylglycine-generating enzyme required for sulfatase activity